MRLIQSTKAALFILAILAINSCSKPSTNGPYQVSDVDGNLYDTIHIGQQIWMKENLGATHFRDGTVIAEIEDGASWASIINSGAKTVAFCNYNKKDSLGTVYGKLYNWYAVTATNQLCPVNWHVPTDTEWHTLALVLDSSASWGPDESEIGGGKLKAINLWPAPNTGATLANSFAAYPGGARSDNGTFQSIGTTAYFWTSTHGANSGLAWARSLPDDSATINRGDANTCNGYSVRCLHD